ncbi:DUF1573 domain-containing protein [Cyclobacterium sp.]|uniref:DUF1573 domain-containing protein n=1 Tax=Cyclobacterium sp. TaxID=1966343 RepID=UPI0019951816|nr:DUF1573 domain-containing protein [Cyclobacterium sp.]MBD3630763.1 DUF1573 domain-containing protein [Cyclobacterium sp.]
MKRIVFLFGLGSLLFSCSPDVKSQDVEGSGLVWEKKQLNIGAVLEEKGTATADFYFVNNTDTNVLIEDVQTDCGCTVADFSRDTIGIGKVGQVKVTYDHQSRGGTFSKMILVKTNLDPDGDSLFLEGVNVPYPKNPQSHYQVKKNGLGFVFETNNLGTLFTNQAKIKPLDFYNFKDTPIQLNQVQTNIPDYIQVQMVPSVVQPESRGVLEITYDPAIKNDFGFVEEELELSFISSEKMELSLNLIAVIHEFFDPTPINQLDSVPKLEISEQEVDLGRISSNKPVSGTLTLENTGPQPLNLRKVVSNCSCLSFELPTHDLNSGQSVDIVFTFDPKGRRGIDHKTLTFFSNDPINPTQTVIIKSRID